MSVNSDSDPDLQAAIQGTAESVAAGALLFVSLSELVSDSFNRKEMEGSEANGLKAIMLSAYALGIGSMAIIGIWA